MKNGKIWFFNSKIVSDNAFRLYSYMAWVATKVIHPKGADIVMINRAHLKRILGLSYNSIQKGIKDLVLLGLIEADPEKNGNKDCIRLTREDEYNKTLLTSLFLSLLSKSTSDEQGSETSDSDVD